MPPREYCPAGHGAFESSSRGGPGQYEPAGQVVHVDAPSGEYSPSEHATGKAEGVAQYDPPGHTVQLTEPLKRRAANQIDDNDKSGA